MLKAALHWEDEGQPHSWSHQTPQLGNPTVQQVSNLPMVCEEDDNVLAGKHLSGEYPSQGLVHQATPESQQLQGGLSS